MKEEKAIWADEGFPVIFIHYKLRIAAFRYIDNLFYCWVTRPCVSCEKPDVVVHDRNFDRLKKLVFDYIDKDKKGYREASDSMSGKNYPFAFNLIENKS